MKRKILSVLVTVLMLFNAVAVSPVMADSVLSSDYTFIDTCYSPELGLYVAVAKDFNTKTSTPAQIWISKDMEQWKKTKSFQQGIHNANPETRQTIVWWEAQHVFVAQMNNVLYYSEDAETWTAFTDTDIIGANQTITTNGDKLAISSRARIKVLDNLEDTPTIYVIDATEGNNTYGKAIGITPEEPYTYAVTDQYKTWMIDPEGALTSAVPNLAAHPFDMTWVDSFNGWIVVNKTAVLRVLASDSVNYTNFSSMVLSDGSTNAAKFTASAAGANYIAVGTDTGKFYIAPNSRDSLTVDTQWYIVQPGGSSEENTEQIRSITAVDDGKFFAVSDKKIFIIEQTEEGWKYYDTSSADIKLEDTRIEIPESGTLTRRLEPVNYNCRGEVSSDPIVSFELITNQLPAGIDSVPVGNSAAELSIESTVTGGHELTYRATTESGRTRDFVITIVDEARVEIRGADEMAVPLEGEEAEVYEYSAAIVGTDGLDMSREVSLKPLSISAGAEYDNGIFRINNGMADGEIILEAHSLCNPENKTEKTIKVSARKPVRLEFAEIPKSLYIPNSGSAEFIYSAEIYDQIGKKMPNADILWTMEPVEIEKTDAVTLDSASGVLKVGSTAVLGTIRIKAAAAQDEAVNDETDVTLLYTDLRTAQEDLAEFTIDTSVPVTENIDFMPERTFGSKITWRSSDESIITTSGIVVRPSREDKTVILTEVSKYGTASAEQKFTLTVKKSENILTDNGKALFTNDSSYGFEARVKAPAGSMIRLVSEKVGTIAKLTADGEYQDLKASYDYRKQPESFEDIIYLECDGQLITDYLKVYEITLELNEVSAAVNKAAYTKIKTDVNSARTLLDAFYDLPVKEELLKQLNSITVTGSSTGGSSGGGGGGGGGSSSSATKGTAPSDANTKTGSEIFIPAKTDDDDYEDKLDTYLLNFKDMKTHWAREDVEYMAELGIVKGDENGKFRPGDGITRAEFAALVTRAMGLGETPYENSFFDVISDDWYSGYVQTCRSNDFMNGYDGLFNPNQDITREEIARVVVSAYNSKSGRQLEMGKALYFNDLDDISYWAYDYIAEAAEMGFVNGVTDELFAPKSYATRAEAAVMLRRVYDKLNNAD